VQDYPAAAAAIRDGTTFAFELAPGSPHAPTEATAELLRRLDMRLVVGIGVTAPDDSWVLTVYGATDHVPLTAVREVMALARASAIRKDDAHE
jgi:hypothetical protein